MPFTTLISTNVLTTHLDDPAFAVIDCRFKLDDETWGAREYAARHIPNAAYAHLDHDLSGPKTGTNGRHPLPDPGTLAQAFRHLGIGNGVQVVAYDQDNAMYAVWWRCVRWQRQCRVRAGPSAAATSRTVLASGNGYYVAPVARSRGR